MSSVSSWIKTDETVKDALIRVVTGRPLFLLPPPLHRFPIRAGHVVEIVGPSSSAKTLILTQAAINCILPKEWKGVQYGGLECNVLFIDLDCRFDVLSLSNALRKRIIGANRSKMKNSDNDCYKELFANCMKRFSYKRCYNSFQFLATLKALQHLLHNEKEKRGASEYMLIVDSIRSFFWMDHALGLPTSFTFTSSRKKISLQGVAEAVVQEINNLQLQHSVVVLLSRSAALGDKRSTSGRVPSNLRHHDFMPSVWKSVISHRVLVHPQGSDRKDQTCASFITEWHLPPVDFSDRFVITDVWAHRMDRWCLFEVLTCAIRNEDPELLSALRKSPYQIDPTKTSEEQLQAFPK